MAGRVVDRIGPNVKGTGSPGPLQLRWLGYQAVPLMVVALGAAQVLFLA